MRVREIRHRHPETGRQTPPLAELNAPYREENGWFGLYLDGIITDEEIALLSDEVRDFIHAYKNTFG